MSYGSLTLVCGPMYAGKTTEMLKRVLWARNGQGLHVRVFKPAFDNRYSETEIVSHDGLRTTAENLTTLPPLDDMQGVDLVVLDEVQFMMEPYVSGDTVSWVRGCLGRGIDVVAGGLDLDINGVPFAITASLAAMADEIIKARANCTVCGRPASKTHRSTTGHHAADGPHIELGATDKYEARCNQHWRM
jgi:Thymidine kinase